MAALWTWQPCLREVVNEGCCRRVLTTGDEGITHPHYTVLCMYMPVQRQPPFCFLSRFVDFRAVMGTVCSNWFKIWVHLHKLPHFRAVTGLSRSDWTKKKNFCALLSSLAFLAATGTVRSDWMKIFYLQPMRA